MLERAVIDKMLLRHVIGHLTAAGPTNVELHRLAPIEPAR
jgi:hypothetical protein